MKRSATEEGHIHKYPRIDQESTRCTPESSRIFQHPFPFQLTASSISEPPLLTSHVNTTPPTTYGGDSYPGPMQGDKMFQHTTALFF